jgi:tetratricopeptide (TPR) repeat protein
MIMPTQDQEKIEVDRGQADLSTSTFNRLATLLSLAEGAWALAVYEDATVRQRIIEGLRSTSAPLPFVEISLLDRPPDPLAIISDLGSSLEHAAPVLCFTNVNNALRELCGYLDLQREALARLPHRLLFWVTEHDYYYLAGHAPNFYSRLSGVFRFPGTTRSPADTVTGTGPTRQPSPLDSVTATRRPRFQVSNEKERQRLIEQLQRRIHDLKKMSHPDNERIGDAWYDLGELYGGATPFRWGEAEAAYLEAARYYSAANNITVRAAALAQAGDAAYRGYNHITSLEHLRTALTLYRLLSDKNPQMLSNEANTLKAIGDVQHFRQEDDISLASYNTALDLYRAIGDRLGEANTLQAIGDVQQFRDEYDAALASYNAALDLYRAVGGRLGEAYTLKAIGDVQHFRDEYDAALASYNAALDLHRAVSDRVGEANALQAIGDAQQFRLEYDAALASYNAALDLHRLVGDRMGEANALQAVGEVQRFRAEYDAALARYNAALDLYRAAGSRLGEANTLKAIGDVQRFRDEYDAALASYNAALDLYRAIGDRLGEANTLQAIGQISLTVRDDLSATKLLQSAIALYQEINDRYSVAAAISNYGLQMYRSNEYALAYLYLQQAADLFVELGIHNYAESDRRSADLMLYATMQMLKSATANHEEAEHKEKIREDSRRLEQHSLMLKETLKSIGYGERDAITLVDKLDPDSKLILEQILGTQAGPQNKRRSGRKKTLQSTPS